MSEQPHPEGVRLLPWRIPSWLVDAVFVAMTVLGLIGRRSVGAETDSLIEWAAMVIAIVVILGRRRYPIPALTLGVVTTVGVVATTDQPSVIMPAVLVALYVVATQYRLRTALVVGVATTVVFASLVVALLEHGRIEGAALASIAWPAFAIAAGAAVRVGRQNLAAAESRALRAEATRELEAGRRVAEERLRIARDVHDLVAHHIAVVNVQSGVAGHLLRSDPDAAETALDAVRDAASTAVGELGELLGVLRAPDDTTTDGRTDPTPDLDAIDDLIASFSASGLAVEHQTTGARRLLSPSAQVAAYRMVQEALTNAHKHGDGAATVAQRFDDEGLEIIVVNRTRSETTSGNGYGLIGMRERLEAIDGELSINQTGGQFTVRAVIPAATSVATRTVTPITIPAASPAATPPDGTP